MSLFIITSQLTYLLLKMYRCCVLLLLCCFLILSRSTSEDLCYTAPLFCCYWTLRMRTNKGQGDVHKVPTKQTGYMWQPSSVCLHILSVKYISVLILLYGGSNTVIQWGIWWGIVSVSSLGSGSAYGFLGQKNSAGMSLF